MLFHLFLARGVFFREEAFLKSFWLFFLKLSFSGKRLLDFGSPIFFTNFGLAQISSTFHRSHRFFFHTFFGGYFCCWHVPVY